MIKGIQKCTLVDYPGKIACTIFIAGCNFRCGYCYNSDLVFNTNRLRSISEGEIVEFLDERKHFLEGVCITGGEPTIFPGLIPLIEKIKRLEYCVKLDTNGTNPLVLKKLLEKNLLDYIAMDIKASMNSYKKVTATKTFEQRITESIELIKNSTIDHEFRTTVIPGIIDEHEIEAIARLLGPNESYFLQQFKCDEKTIGSTYRRMESLPKERLEHFKRVAERFVGKVELRNC